MLASGLWCCECRVRIVVLNEVDKIGRRGNAVSPVLEDARQPAVTRGFGHSRYSMSGPNMSQVLANSFVETAMRGNVGAMAKKCGKFGSRCRFFRSIDFRSDSSAAFLSSLLIHGLMVAKHLSDASTDGER
jgi:hypothetical protein